MTLRVAVRCDGGTANGAGHVGRCIPVAAALRARGADARLVGRYDGVAAWLVERSGLPVEAPGGAPCGIGAGGWDAALIDLYLDHPTEMCDAAGLLPLATVGESSRCPDAGTWIDYHAGSAQGADDRRLGGPAYVPLDPRFAGRTPQIGDRVQRVLVLAGGSGSVLAAAGRLAVSAAEALPGVTVCAPAGIAAQAGHGVAALDDPVDVLDALAGVDVAIVGAGMTLYEVAAAGVPCIAVGLVDNQRVVIEGCQATGIAIGVDGTRDDPAPAVLAGLVRLGERGARAALSARARAVIDGKGAERIADALISVWTRP